MDKKKSKKDIEEDLKRALRPSKKNVLEKEKDKKEVKPSTDKSLRIIKAEPSPPKEATLERVKESKKES